MENSMSRMLVEAVVKKALKDIKESPERGIRNLVDMASQFANGRFQHNFFVTAQTMLQNENSAYYGLVRDVVAYADADRLLTFGMNLGYNGCTEGARRIRYYEEKLDCNIPWTVLLQVDTEDFDETQHRYEQLISEGEQLGIYTWMMFAADCPQKAFTLAAHHPDSAFCFFCRAEELTCAVLDDVQEYKNIMLVIRYEEHAADVYAELRNRGLLYSVWYPYGQKDTEIIINGDLFSSTQQFSPIFTVLVPEMACPEAVQKLVYQEITRARREQTFRTLTWELHRDNSLVDSIISGDACFVCFDKGGSLCDRKGKNKNYNLFRNALIEILKNAYPKKAGDTT